MFVYLSEQNMPYLPLIISIKLIGFLIILAIAKNNKKRLGQITRKHNFYKIGFYMFNGLFISWFNRFSLNLEFFKFLSPNFKEEVKKQGKKIWDFSFGGKLFIIASLLFVVLLFGFTIDFLIDSLSLFFKIVL